MKLSHTALHVALTGVHAGWVLSRESLYNQDQSSDAVEIVGRQHRMSR